MSQQKQQQAKKPMNSKIRHELAYSECLQVCYLRQRLEESSKQQLSSAESEVLRAWEQVTQAEESADALATREICLKRKDKILKDLKLLDEAIEQARSSVMAVEGPSDVLCAVEDETARSLCIDNISSSTSEELQEAIWNLESTTKDFVELGDHQNPFRVTDEKLFHLQECCYLLRDIDSLQRKLKETLPLKVTSARKHERATVSSVTPSKMRDIIKNF